MTPITATIGMIAVTALPFILYGINCLWRNRKVSATPASIGKARFERAVNNTQTASFKAYRALR